MPESRESTLIPVQPVYLVERFPPLHTELMRLLRRLRPDDWARPTACALWSVKDTVAHLLDTALRRLSYGRDRMPALPNQDIADYIELVAYLNRLNAEWVVAARRLSPGVLQELLETSEPKLHAYFRSLDPHAQADFGVAWAGEDSSPVWFDIGREYTERWLHQQQIRDAVGAPPLAGREWLHPVLALFVRAVPVAYRTVDRPDGTTVLLAIEGPAGGDWTLRREAGAWRLLAGRHPSPEATVTLTDDTAWRLFSKGLTGGAARSRVRIEGDQALGEVALGALAVMA
jgi:uncharacterized protein (TIGR03083 family)